MEEIRCPMCSKLNPAENEECQYCNARLKPLEIQAGSDLEPAGPNDSFDDVPEWIKRLSSFGSSASAEPEAGSAEARPKPEPQEPGSWLVKLKGDIEAFEQASPAQAEQPGPAQSQPGSQAEAEEGQASPPFSDDENLPDWLKNIRAAASKDKATPPLGVPVFEPGASSDDAWLDRLRNQKLESPEEKPFITGDYEGVPQIPPEEPDWLHAFPHQKDEPGAENTEDIGLGKLPDWLSAGQPAGGSEVFSDWSQGGQAVQPAEIPDWLGSETPSKPAAEDSVVGEQPDFEQESKAEPAGDKPDWLRELEARGSQVPAQPGGPVLTFDQPSNSGDASKAGSFTGEELPDWLASFGPAPAQAPVQGPAQAPQPGTPAAHPPVEPEAEDLAPADVPGWLRAMRPIETVAPALVVRNETDQREEKSGPLAGLRGTLPAEPSMGGYQRPPSYIARLQPTGNQERYRSIFEQLIANEKEPQAASVPGLISQQRVWKLAIAILLLLAVLIPALTGIRLMPLPGLFPPETVDMVAAIDGLPADTPVLVGIEYEPSLAGEMESAAAGVVDHLMQKSARLAVISTSATGPALADHLFSQVTRQPSPYHEDYISGARLANLGYLAGGPAGLMEFALHPQLAAPALQGVERFTDFGLILLITDDQQTGRTWLEQIQPRANANTPLLVVSSAQAAPVLASYLDGRQVDGLAAGLPGGTVYEQIRQNPGLGTRHWQSFALVMAVSLGAILVGTLLDLILEYLAGRKVNAEA